MEKDEKQKILQELGGIGEDIYDELVGDFIAQADLQLRDLNQALSNGDLSAMQSLAHTIKGSSGNLRLYTISAIAKDLEF
ncbi:MAG: hypothetical protein DRP78_06820 [Candidatus Omnitrophota bacterium]|nr:MAG: hypothetical protein DRP78_06820 [Candidatus Omnitrophota bacterium]